MTSRAWETIELLYKTQNSPKDYQETVYEIGYEARDDHQKNSLHDGGFGIQAVLALYGHGLGVQVCLGM